MAKFEDDDNDDGDNGDEDDNDEDGDGDEEEFAVEDVAYEAYNKIDALIQLLVKKNMIKESEVDAEYDKLIEDLEKAE